LVVEAAGLSPAVPSQPLHALALEAVAELFVHETEIGLWPETDGKGVHKALEGAGHGAVVVFRGDEGVSILNVHNTP
jgi:hypothetical protein